MSSSRGSKEYKEWRLAVLGRDKWECKICSKKKFLHVHHIKPYKTYKKLRTLLSNGIVLCRECHKILRYRELAFVSLFNNLINNQQLNKTEQTLFNLILKNKRIKLYGGKGVNKINENKKTTKTSKVNRNKRNAKTIKH